MISDIVQFSIDIEDADLDESQIAEILENNGIHVVGISFAERWKSEEYWK